MLWICVCMAVWLKVQACDLETNTVAYAQHLPTCAHMHRLANVSCLALQDKRVKSFHSRKKRIILTSQLRLHILTPPVPLLPLFRLFSFYIYIYISGVLTDNDTSACLSCTAKLLLSVGNCYTKYVLWVLIQNKLKKKNYLLKATERRWN